MKPKAISPSVAVYPGTFDPIHNGHIDVIRRSAAIFDRVIVAVAFNPHKDMALFSADERIDMIRESIAGMDDRTTVDKFTGLAVDYAARVGAGIIIRSLRAVTDFDYELQMAHMNRLIGPRIETVFLFANPKLFFSASRLIKEVASHGKWPVELVPEPVMRRLKERFHFD